MARTNPALPGFLKVAVRFINVGLRPFGKKLNVFISRL